MKIVNNENETIIYPMLEESEKETDDDFCIVLSNTFTMINNRIIDEDDIPKIIESLERATELI